MYLSKLYLKHYWFHFSRHGVVLSASTLQCVIAVYISSTDDKMCCFQRAAFCIKVQRDTIWRVRPAEMSDTEQGNYEPQIPRNLSQWFYYIRQMNNGAKSTGASGVITEPGYNDFVFRRICTLDKNVPKGETSRCEYEWHQLGLRMYIFGLENWNEDWLS